VGGVTAPRVLFIHGQESGPHGTKAQRLAERFTTSTPQMETSDFEGCVARQADEIARFQPDLVVGSSFGGAVAVALLQRGLWRGPTLLLAQAALELGLRAELPAGVRVWIVHGTRDDVVPPASSERLARSGSPGLVSLFLVDDDHRLSASVADGRMLAWVRALLERKDADDEAGGLDRHLRVFFEEPTLWPVLATVAAGLATVLAWGLATASRTRNPALLFAIAALVVSNGVAVRRDWRGGRPGPLGGSLLVLWALALAIAWVAGRYGVL
jgi:hypothetical protein